MHKCISIKYSAFILIFVFSLFPCLLQASDLPILGKISPGAVSPGGIASFSDPSKSGITDESVNLYTGQHNESFPIMALTGKGEFGLSISLDYDGGAYNQAKLENRIAQASPCGLGFNLGTYSIISDHGGTSYLYDDKYTLIFDNTSYELRHIKADSFMTQDGKPWVILRNRAVVQGDTAVISWIIKMENGVIYQFGDSTADTANWNSTRNIHRYGHFIGNSVTDEGVKYPYQWDLKRIRDIENKNWIEFSYLQDAASILVMDSYGDTIQSQVKYTQASYVNKIETSIGSKILFYFGTRSDYQRYYGINNYEFYYKRKLDSMFLEGPNDSVISRVVFKYSYLNSNRDSTFKKLLLDSIVTFSGDKSDCLPPLYFEYFVADTSLTWYGAINKIHYSSGALKQLYYGTVPDSVNFAKLDINIHDTSNMDHNLLNSPANLCQNIFSIHRMPLKIGYWDGYWKTKDFDINYYPQYEEPGIGPEGWFVLYDRVLERFIINRWKGGYWQADTLSDTVSRASGLQVFLYAGKDCFVAVLGQTLERGEGENAYYATIADKCYYFQWDGLSWHKFHIYDKHCQYGDDLTGIQLGNGLFALSFGCSGNSHFVYGKFNFANGNLYKNEFDPFYNYSMDGSKFAIASDYLGYVLQHMLIILQWNQNSSSFNSFEYEFAGNWDVETICGLMNGFVSTYNYEVISFPNWGRSAYIDSRFFTGDSLKCVQRFLDCTTNWWDFSITKLNASTHSLITYYESSGNTNLWEWLGNKWEYSCTIQENSSRKSSAWHYADKLLWALPSSDHDYPYPQLNHALAYRYVGVASPLSQRWSKVLDDTTRFGPAMSDWALVKYLNTDPRKINICLSHPYLNNGDYRIDTSATYANRFYASKDAVGMVKMFGTTGLQTVDSTADFNFYKIYGLSYSGKATICVVDSVSIQAGDDAPIMKNYSYYGGLLNEGATTPRFAKVSVSTSYVSGAMPDGYQVNCFYNDIDSTGFYDTTIYAGMSFPDLVSSSRYGIQNGGHRLDGQVYCSYSYDAANPNYKIDSTYYYYSLYSPHDSLYDVYRTKLDKICTFHEGLGDTTYYYYDTYSGQLAKTITTGGPQGVNIIDSSSYAYSENGAIRSDNALTLAGGRYKIADSSGFRTTLNRSKTNYAKNGSWQPSRSLIWRDCSNSDTTTISDKYQEREVEVYYIIDTILPVVKQFVDTIRVAQEMSCYVGRDEYSGGYGYAKFSINNITIDSIGSSGEMEYWGSPVVDSGDIVAIEAKGISGNFHFSGTYTYYTGKDTTWGGAIRTFAIFPDSASFDHFGNLTNSLGVSEDTACTKYDKYGFLPVAAASNCFTGDLVIQDFEQGIDWDGWEYSSDSVYTPLIDTAGAVLTGKYGLKIYDNPNSIERTWGPFRYIPVDSLTHGKYFFSCWVKSNCSTLVYCKCLDNNLDTCSNGVKLAAKASSSGQWSLMTGVFDLSNVNAQCLRYIKLQLAIPNGASNIAFFDNFRFHTLDAHVTTKTYDPATFLVTSISDLNNIPTKYTYDKFMRPVGTFNYKNDVISRIGYNLDSIPKFITQTQFRSGYDSTVSVSYYDALGRLLQTRTTGIFDSAGTNILTSIVSGAAQYDSRGRIIKSYKPYFDLVGGRSVVNYTPNDSIYIEAHNYYNGVLAADCGTKPFDSSVYYAGIRGQIHFALSPGDNYCDTSKGIEYKDTTDAANNLAISTTFDQDDNKTVSLVDKWGLVSRQIAYDSTLPGNTDSILTTTYKNIRGLTDSVTIGPDSTGNFRTIRKYQYDDLGHITNEWRIDYGNIAMLYDEAGRLRLMMNDKRRTDSVYYSGQWRDGCFVYFKYDIFGRKIEEGLCYDTLNFTQLNADDPNYPGTVYQGCIFEALYKWYFDFYPNSTSNISYGQLCRVQNKDSSYYRKYYYYPLANKDTVVVRLLVPYGADKRITHEYDRQGNIIFLRFWPKVTQSGTYRTNYYDYNIDGSLYDIRRDVHGTLKYAQYDYNAGGGIDNIILGSYEDEFNDTVSQRITYKYDPRDMLTFINDPDAVDSSLTTGGLLHPHFGEHIVYDTSGGYYNGRVRSVKTANSGGSLLIHDYTYTYSQLGWLTKADHSGGTTNDQEYDYNYLGNRTQLIANGVTTSYIYDTIPGSSKLLSFTGMGNHKMYYDKVGNLIADTSRPIYSQEYDYRNLLTFSLVGPLYPNKPYPDLSFAYDEASRRIMKHYHYYYLGSCDGGIDQIIGQDSLYSDEFSSSSIDGSAGDTCIHWTISDEHYLYDGNALLAIFDASDAVTQSYVNGPNGRVAVYWNNADSGLYYFLNDHLVSTRVMVDQYGKVKEYINYQPFGGVIESWSSYSEPLTFTGKQRDLHSTFDYYYFGARYYDYRIGQFASVDKASQFPGGYIYGGNNPIMGIDPDGNFLFGIFTAAIWGTLFSSGSAAVTSAVTGEWSNFGKSILAGALTGGIGAGVSGLFGPLGNGLAFQALNQAGTSAATAGIMGQKIGFNSLVASSIGSMAAGGLIGDYSAVKGRWLKNVAGETLNMGVSGAISGGVSGLAYNALEGNNLLSNMGNFVGRGALGGATSAITKSLIMGAPRLRTNDPKTIRQLDAGAKVYGCKSQPLYRSGGLLKLLGMTGFAGFGRDVIINESKADNPNYLWIHETIHFWQYKEAGYGNVLSHLSIEQATSFMAKLINFMTGSHIEYDPYSIVGDAEWEAQYMTDEICNYIY
ncbi:membrane hypothetical protein [Candidatus Zixiibacteriota bacterium]|nr:membrane hypothetical protein [candidate division Zixibacteria bacterium]